jgi:transposase
MNNRTTSIPSKRHLAVDLHKHYLVVGGVNAQQEVVLPPRRLDLDDWPGWAKTHLWPSDTLVVEATTNTWEFYDQTRPLVGRLLVANAGKIALIAKTRVKTDNLDVLKLARLSVANLIPEVWVPPMAVRELRDLIAHRQRLTHMHTMTANRLQSLLHRHQVVPPAGELFWESHRTWWAGLAVSATEHLRIRQDLATLDHLRPQLAEVDAELARLSTEAPWAQDVPLLMQLPGFGLLTVMTVLGAIGDATRFETAKQLVGYAGLGASVHDSGQTHRSGRITKQGRKDVRRVLIEAAWTAVQRHPHWKREFEHLTVRMAKGKAIIALARKLLVAVWHVLSKRVVDVHADPHVVGLKFFAWSWKLTSEQHHGLSRRQFVRYHLMQLGLGNDLTHIQRGGTKRPLAPVEEVLQLRPELSADA